MHGFDFHPAVAQWFQQRFSTPTEPQAQGWPAIQSGAHVLISAPTGSGKTLAAFLASLDQLFREAVTDALPDETRVVYVSPLKALSNDIRKNLEEPLAGIRSVLAEQGLAVPEVRAEVRTGDTPAVKRLAIAKKPPHILVTTPESLYLLLTSESGRRTLRTARTLIVDEIHAVVSNRRGSHLAISMERLQALAGRTIQRIGLSATQKPIEEVARFLVGSGPLQVSRINTWSDAAFSLTPALSPGERESPLQSGEISGVSGGPSAPAEAHRLPEGEGRGEGDGGVLNPDVPFLPPVPGPAGCQIIEVGRRRELDLAVEIPKSPLEAVMPNEVWEEVYGRLAELIEQHKTTLVFVNTRRLAERVTHHLTERLGAAQVTSHHGSLSAKLRLDAEDRLKRGELKALVATASLELGIDIGSVDLVCQLGSTRSISTLLQRVGRAEHKRGGLPKGRLFPLTRDELVECATTIRSLRRGDLDSLLIPQKPLDILAQQIVACAACEDWSESELFALTCRAYPYRNLSRAEFDAVVKMLAEGFSTQRGRRGALLHYDGVNGRLRARRGARLIALTSGGAIPDNADYRVVVEPSQTFIGTVNEDFAVESMAGDIFQLGNASWKILGINSGMVRVEDAHGQPPGIPFWLGEAPARTNELSHAVSDFRREIGLRIANAVRIDAPGENAHFLSPHPGPLPEERKQAAPTLVDASGLCSDPARQTALPLPKGEGRGEGKVRVDLEDSSDECAMSSAQAPHLRNAVAEWLAEETGLSIRAAIQIAEYFGAVHRALGVIPSQDTLVIERFFDESGGMQLVLHSPWGSRINRAWGLALRKRFCRKFNFELQAAATDDAIVLSLGTQHSFPLEEVFHYLHSNTVRDVLVQALLDAPMFTVRWRWNAARSLAIPRQRGSRRTPPPLQRMEAEDLIAAVFPDQLACLENIVGDREIPDHPLVNQTIHDCLTEAMDIDGLVALLQRIESGSIRCVAKDLPEPSPLAHEILNAKPYAFLDNAPLEERRTQAVYTRRALDSASNAALGILDAAAIHRVCEEAWPAPANEDEMHDALMQFGLLADNDLSANVEIQSDRPSSSSKHLPRIKDEDECDDEDDRSNSVFAHALNQGSGEIGPTTGPPGQGWPRLLRSLAQSGRATRMCVGPSFWVAVERLSMVSAVYPNAVVDPPVAAPGAEQRRSLERADALRELLRGRLELSGPVTAAELSRLLEISSSEIETALLALEAEGFILRGRFRPDAPEQEWCERRLLARIHRLTINRLRAEIQPVPIAEFCRFLAAWQRVDPEHQVEGPEGVEALLELLDGYELAAGVWEPDVLCARAKDYDPQWLDRVCFTGRVGWGRLSVPGNASARSFSMGPLRSSPISIFAREHLRSWLALCAQVGQLEFAPDTRKVLEILSQGGALFFAEIVRGTGLLPSQAERALGELSALGLVTADSFDGLRALLIPAHKKPSLANTPTARRRKTVTSVEFAGRWSLLRQAHGQSQISNSKSQIEAESDPIQREKAIELFARTLLRRYGVVFRRLLERESIQVPWYELGRVFRRLEARGEIRGGHFVAGVSGEQFALPEAINQLRSIRKESVPGRLIALSAADPLNLAGILTPGRRIPAVAANRILLRDGVIIAALAGEEVLVLDQSGIETDQVIEHALRVGKLPASLRRYYG